MNHQLQAHKRWDWADLNKTCTHVYERPLQPDFELKYEIVLQNAR